MNHPKQLLLIVLTLLGFSLLGPASADAGSPAIPRPQGSGDVLDSYTSGTYDFGHDVYVDPPIDISEGCPTWRWLAIQADPWSECPEITSPPDWPLGTSYPLFGEKVADLPWELKPFCVYETDNPNARVRQKFNQAVAKLHEWGQLAEVESSCGAVTPASTVPRQANQVDGIWSVMEGTLYEQTKPLPEITLKTPLGPQPLAEFPRTRLAVLDTQPTDRLDDYAYSPHGLALLRIARRLVCQDGDAKRCAAEVVPELALPIVELDPDDPTGTIIDDDGGGHIGTVDQIAQAVWRAVLAWDRSKQRHLVLNLSLGWVGELFGGVEEDPADWPISVRALYQALRVASCRGAMTVASSGNLVGGPQVESGPVLPAGWETRRAPRSDECHDVLAVTKEDKQQPPPSPWPWPWTGKDADTCPAPAVDEPLVYGAGGVHADDVPLVNSRPDSEPPRVAYGDHALVYDTRIDGWPSVLTGSSVAAVVVSSAAAAVWHYRPELSRAEVMALVEDAGTQVGRDPAVTFSPGSNWVRRVRVCPAVRQALTADCVDGWDPWGSACPKVQCPEPAVTTYGEFALEETCARTAIGRRIDLSEHRLLGEQAFCDRPEQFGVVPPDNPCPFRQFWGVCARPWGCPQPDGDPCPGCPSGPPGQGGGGRLAATAADADSVLNEATRSVRIHVDPSWPGEVFSATLGIGDARFALDIDFSDPRQHCTIVEGIPERFFDDQATAAIYWLTSKGSWLSPIFLPR